MKRKEIEQFIFGNIFLLANKLQMLGDSVIEEITLKQWFLLIMIKNINKENPSITEIADFAGTTRQNARKMIDILENKGYVVTGKSQNDKRNVGVLLTQKTHDFFCSFEEKGDILLGDLFSGIETVDLEITSKALNSLHEKISDMEGNHEEN